MEYLQLTGHAISQFSSSYILCSIYINIFMAYDITSFALLCCSQFWSVFFCQFLNSPTTLLCHLLLLLSLAHLLGHLLLFVKSLANLIMCRYCVVTFATWSCCLSFITSKRVTCYFTLFCCFPLRACYRPHRHITCKLVKSLDTPTHLLQICCVTCQSYLTLYSNMLRDSLPCYLLCSLFFVQ